jgi:hypothetical protein
MLHKIAARVRGLQVIDAPENREDEQLQINSFGDEMMAQALPDLAEIVRLGNSWQVMSAVYTALTAVPTTAAIFTIWNGEPGGGKSYVIDSVAVVKVVADTTQVDSTSAFYQLVRPPVAPVSDAGIEIQSLSGRKFYDGKARTVNGGVTFANRWEMGGTSPHPATALAGTGWQVFEEKMNGRFVVPPTAQFSVHRAEVTATANKFRVTFRWHEIQLPVVS